MKKLISIILSLVLVLSLVGCGNTTTETPESTSTSVSEETKEPAKAGTGTFTAAKKGMNDNVTVEVVLTEGHIDSVKVTEHKETPNISDKAISDIPANIVAAQSVNVDVISGATFTSKAIIEGVKDVLTQAGLDVNNYMAKQEAAKEEDKTLDCDVVVVGAGGAGLASAIEAAKGGAKVIVVEKMPKVGGNTLISGGGYNAVDPERQGAMNPPIEDSEDLFFEQTMKGGDNIANPDLVRVLVHNALDGVKFLEQYGMVWEKQVSTAPGGLYQRRHMPGNGKLGAPMINALKKGCEEEKVEIVVDTKAEKIIMKDGKAAGVECTGKTGNKVTVNATRGVIIATGGFGANVEMREKYNDTSKWPTLGAQVKTTNQPGATGDGIDMALAAGADLVDMKEIQLFAYGDPNTGAMTGSIMRQPEDAIYVNKEGKRFVNEYERRDVVSAAVLKQTDSQMYVIVDGKVYPNDDAPTDFSPAIREEIEAGRVVKGNTIEELAKAMNVDPAVLKETIDKYNAGVDANKDEFGKTPMHKIDTAPFYGNLRTPVVHHTMGGVKINTNAEVVDKAGNVIPGLYAAGEVTGGIHGTNRVGANALTDIIVFGRIAGTNAAANK